MNEENINKLDTFELFLNYLNDNLKKGNILGLKKNILNNIIIYVCNVRNPLLLELISEIIDFENIPFVAYIGKFGFFCI